jgi:hypothetical protein
MKLVRDSGTVPNGTPQFVGRPEGELQWQADVGRVRPRRTSGFSACEVLWPIAGRSGSRAAALLIPSCARPKIVSLSHLLGFCLEFTGYAKYQSCSVSGPCSQ